MNTPLHHWFAKLPRPSTRFRTQARPRWTCLRPETPEDRRLLSVFNVNSLADVLNPGPGVVTLRSAIEVANAKGGNNTINLTVPGTYKITIPPASSDDTPTGENNATGDFDIFSNPNPLSPSSLTIVNTSGGKVAVSGNNLDRVFDINPNNVPLPAGKFSVALKGFTVEKGVASPGDGPDATGGGIRDQGNVSLTLAHMVVKNNTSTADGGGIVLENTVPSSFTLTITDSTISNNHAGDAGGGVDVDGPGTVSVTGSVITGNTDSNQGAGIYIDSITVMNDGTSVLESANTTIANTIISNNMALANGITASGGGISNAGDDTITILNSTVKNNSSFGMGGGFSDENNVGTLFVKNSLFLNNVAAMDGAGIQEGGPSTTIINTEIKGNSSGGSGGGGLFANGTTLTVQSSTFANNTAAVNGGGIEVERV